MKHHTPKTNLACLLAAAAALLQAAPASADQPGWEAPHKQQIANACVGAARAELQAALRTAPVGQALSNSDLNTLAGAADGEYRRSCECIVGEIADRWAFDSLQAQRAAMEQTVRMLTGASSRCAPSEARLQQSLGQELARIADERG